MTDPNPLYQQIISKCLADAPSSSGSWPIRLLPSRQISLCPTAQGECGRKHGHRNHFRHPAPLSDVSVEPLAGVAGGVFNQNYFVRNA
ncbi:MAG: hypothetical protein LWW81_03990 [Rhodocyclales bacterium]|nr:hypothetical protein [Rhodocyclales bacterium]